jgi:phenylacetate-CoA ligase
MDELVVRIEIAAEHASHGAVALDALRDEAMRRLQRMLGLRSKIEIVVPGTFPRTDFKARRVIDDREVFRDMNARFGSG